jgi:hypothetical protein
MQQGDAPAKYELLAETPTRFFRRGNNATITFEGNGGAIDRLTVAMGAQHRTATRKK